MAKKRQYVVHPKQIIITLIIAAVTMLFLAFSISYMYNRIQSGIAPVKLPNLFYVNTIFLLASSYTLFLAKKSYLADNTSRYKMLIGLTIIFSIIFLVLQVFAWQQMHSMNIFVHAANTGSYLYLISATHFAHVIGGLPFLIVFYINALKKMRSPVSVLIYFSDPEKKRDLQLLTIYWHYIDVLWIYLVLFFLINYWIQ